MRIALLRAVIPTGAGFSLNARSLCAACGAEGPWQDLTLTPTDPSEAERAMRGVYFTHVGLTRKVLGDEFPQKFSEYQSRKY